jgi:CheY-like chemotaxis protein
VKILLAEDSLTNQLLIGQMLADMGAEVEIAPDGLEALHWLDRETFDIVLVDIDLPRISGLDVIRAIRSREHLHAQTPVVAVTAYTLREKREEIYKAGADAVLAKPVAGLKALGLAVQAALDRHHGRARPDADAAPVAAVNVSTFDNLLQIAGRTGVPELLSRLTSDLERTAGALRLALGTGDQPAIRAETHVLIALAGAVGAEQLQRMSETLNASAHRRTDPMRETLGQETLIQIGRLVSYVRSRAATAETTPK